MTGEKPDKPSDYLGWTGLAMIVVGFSSNLLRLAVSRRREPHKTTNGLLGGITLILGGLGCWTLYWMTHYEDKRQRREDND